MSTETQIQLAPAAGSGIGKLVADALLADPEFIPAMVAAAMGGLRAVRSWYDKANKQMMVEEDFRVRVQTFALLLAHMEGEPIRRIIHQHMGTAGELDLRAALQDSPALADAVIREVEKANWRKSGRNRKPAPVEAEPAELE